LRRLATGRLGFAASAMSDDRVDRVLDRLTDGSETSIAAALDGLNGLSLEAPAWKHVIEELVVGETRFFRQGTWFSQLEEQVLKPLLEERLRTGRKRLRLWSAGCATGEETYTLAMLVDRFLPSRDGWQISIVGTDINARYLDAARRGVYHARSLRELDQETRERYFRAHGADGFKISAPVRKLVSWATLNLVDGSLPDDERFADVDLIVCRNVLIYLMPEQQRSVARRLGGCLAERGWLAVAPAEAVADWYRPLTPVNFPSAIFFRAAPAPSSGRPQAPAAAAPGKAPQRNHREHVTIAVGKPPRSDDAIERIRGFADRGELDAARRHCEELLASEGLHYDAYLLLALVCNEMRDDAAALQAAQRAIYLNPTSAPAHFICGTTFARLGRKQRAQQKMNDVLQLLDSGPVTTSAAWDVTEDRLRSAAADYLAGGREIEVTVGAR
jgi:chemotaxis protein methyltransferase CheR